MTGLECVDVAQAIEAELRAGSVGGTLLVNGQPATASVGYWVGGVVPSFVLEIREEVFNVFYPIYLWLKQYEGESIDFVGFWLDDGVLYVDIVEWVMDVNTALDIAQARYEKAVFDIFAGESVYV